MWFAEVREPKWWFRNRCMVYSFNVIGEFTSFSYFIIMLNALRTYPCRVLSSRNTESKTKESQRLASKVIYLNWKRKIIWRRFFVKPDRQTRTLKAIDCRSDGQFVLQGYGSYDQHVFAVLWMGFSPAQMSSTTLWTVGERDNVTLMTHENELVGQRKRNNARENN